MSPKKRFKLFWKDGEDMSPFFSKKLRQSEVILPHIDIPPNQVTKINFEGGRPYVRRRPK